MKKKCLTYLFIFFQAVLWSQNQHEPQQWKEVVTPHTKVIYKENQEKDALKIANTIEYIQKHNYKSIGYHGEPIAIILRANTTQSNGFVTYSPFRSEFFNTPPPTFNDLGTTDWLSTLAIHEYRHVQQFLNHKSGFTSILYSLFGESGWAVGSILAIPNWYFEGDAVVMETALTESGRGRLPSFTSLQRALYQENSELYSYAKIRNGSYKSLVPNQYPTGYQMLNYYRNHYDQNQLDDIARKASSYRFPFYSFSHFMKKETGLTTKKLYQISANSNKVRWQQQRDSLATSKYKSYIKPSETVAFYSFPQMMDNKKIVALKSTLSKIPAFYEIDTLGKEQKMTSAHINIDDYFEYEKNQIVYTGASYHPRYNYTDYNDVYIYNIATQLKKRLSYKKRYFSPSFNNDNSKVVVVDGNQSESRLVVLDSKDGSVLKEINLTGHISRPKFYKDDSFIYVKQEHHKVAIFLIDKNLKEKQITLWTSHTINNLYVHQNKVYYSASFNGIDNIYQSALNTNKPNIYQITNVHIGAYQPSVANDTLYFTERTSKGTKISYTQITSTPFEHKEPVKMDWNNDKTVEFEKGSILNKIDSKSYATESYNSILGDLKFHDWSYGFNDQIISANVTATNLLNDFNLAAGTEVYLNENNSFGVATVASYKKWFPMISLGLEYKHRDYNDSINSNAGNIQFQQLSLNPSVTIPLSQINGNYSNNMTINVGYEYEKIFDRTFTDNNNNVTQLDSPFFGVLESTVSLSSLRQKARQHINTRAGFSSFLKFDQALNGIFKGHFFKTNNRIFLPGLISTHNSYLTANYQLNTVNDGFRYINLNADTFNYARGFETLINKKAFKLSYNYQLPLLYPDFGLWGITYFRRIRANLFADFSNITLYGNQKTEQDSTGFEIIFDNTFFSIGESEIGLGYRGSYLLSDDIQNPSHKYVSTFFISTTLF
ncbi:TolB family protein [Wenyingzhuangia sp. IMCC45533]